MPILLEMAPEQGAGAPQALAAISRRIVAVGLLLDSVADRLNEAAREVLALAEQGVPRAEGRAAVAAAAAAAPARPSS